MTKLLQELRTVLPAGALALMLIAGTPALAFAEGGISRGSGTSASTGSKAPETEHATESSTEMHATSESSATTEIENKNETAHVKGAKLVKELKAEHKSKKSDAEVAKSCENHKDGLETKFASIARNGQAYQTRIDDIFAKTLDYKTTNGLNPDGFAALVATAKAAQTTAAASVAALASAKPTVDCTNKAVATDVATFKMTAATARKDLKAYKQAVKAVVKSLRDVNEVKETKTTETKTTEGSN